MVLLCKMQYIFLKLQTRQSWHMLIFQYKIKISPEVSLQLLSFSSQKIGGIM